MKSFSKQLKPFIGKPLSVVINEEDESLNIFDWNEFEKKHNELISKTKGMSETQMHDFLGNNESELMQIYDFFMDDDCIEKVENKEWIPFGALGLVHNTSSYAEMGHAGLLLFDVATDEENPPVILFLDSEEEVIADSFSDLEIIEDEDADFDEDEEDFNEEDFDEEDFDDEDFEDEDLEDNQKR